MPINLYLDTNLYRYIAHKELVINTYGEVAFSFSTAHFDDILANENNRCILETLELVKGGEIVANENRSHEVDSDGVRLDYSDLEEKFDQYQRWMAENQQAMQPILDMMMTVYGAPMKKLKKTIPKGILDLTDDLQFLDADQANNIRTAAIDASLKLQTALESFTPESLPVLRAGLGLNSGASGIVNESNENPIDLIWEKIKSNEEGYTKQCLFGDKLVDDINNGMSRTSTVPLCHAVLNMLGYYADDGLPDQEKQKSILADGNHIAFGSYCDVFLTSDRRLFNKAKAIFAHKQYACQIGRVVYNSEGMELNVFDPSIVEQVPESQVRNHIRRNPVLQSR